MLLPFNISSPGIPLHESGQHRRQRKDSYCSAFIAQFSSFLYVGSIFFDISGHLRLLFEKGEKKKRYEDFFLFSSSSCSANLLGYSEFDLCGFSHPGWSCRKINSWIAHNVLLVFCASFCYCVYAVVAFKQHVVSLAWSHLPSPLLHPILALLSFLGPSFCHDLDRLETSRLQKTCISNVRKQVEKRLIFFHWTETLQAL